MAKMKHNDRVYWMLVDSFESVPNKDIHDPECYICTDPEYAQMGLPLCYACLACGRHVPADDPRCESCGWDNSFVPKRCCDVELTPEEPRRSLKETKEDLGEVMNEFYECMKHKDPAKAKRFLEHIKGDADE